MYFLQRGQVLVDSHQIGSVCKRLGFSLYDVSSILSCDQVEWDQLQDLKPWMNDLVCGAQYVVLRNPEKGQRLCDAQTQEASLCFHIENWRESTDWCEGCCSRFFPYMPFTRFAVTEFGRIYAFSPPSDLDPDPPYLLFEVLNLPGVLEHLVVVRRTEIQSSLGLCGIGTFTPIMLVFRREELVPLFLPKCV